MGVVSVRVINGVIVIELGVIVNMRMRAAEQRLVGVRVMAIVVTMQMFVRDGDVMMREPPLLGEMKRDADQE